MVDWRDSEEMSQDDSVIDLAIDDMKSMCGNRGQTALIELGEQDFRDWANNAFEEFEKPDPADLILQLRQDLPRSGYEGTHEIWWQGMKDVMAALNEEIKEDEEYQLEMDLEDLELAAAAEALDEALDSEAEDFAEEDFAAEEEGAGDGLLEEEAVGEILLEDLEAEAIFL